MTGCVFFMVTLVQTWFCLKGSFFFHCPHHSGVRVEDARGRYTQYYSTARLRRLAVIGRLAALPNAIASKTEIRYPEYPQMLAMLDLDIGLSPLADTPFNRSKSHIKWLDYAALEQKRVHEIKHINRPKSLTAGILDGTYARYLKGD